MRPGSTRPMISPGLVGWGQVTHADLEAEEWVGRTVRLADGGDGVDLVVGEGRAG